MSTKQKILNGHGPSNLNLGIFVCSFDVCWAPNQSALLTLLKIRSKIIKLLNMTDAKLLRHSPDKKNISIMYKKLQISSLHSTTFST